MLMLSLLAILATALIGRSYYSASKGYASRRALYAVPEDDLYKSPIQLLVSKDGRRLFVTCENTDGYRRTHASWWHATRY